MQADPTTPTLKPTGTQRLTLKCDVLLLTSGVKFKLRRYNKENMTDFIAKKREIFLVQMSLDTKRAEIRKLEERALQREEVGRGAHPPPSHHDCAGAQLVMYHMVYRCSPGHPPHSD